MIEACPRAGFLHADLLELDFLEPAALKAGVFKRPETDASKRAMAWFRQLSANH